MPLTNSGQISLSAIATEFGGDAPHALSEYYGKGNCPASGEIQLAVDFYGTANTYDAQYLVVAGGGAGCGGVWQNIHTGGGGAGGMVAGTTTFTPGASSLSVTVGAGGTHNSPVWPSSSGRGGSGNTSSFGSLQSTVGGGGGGHYQNGGSGGSGGGAGGEQEHGYYNKYGGGGTSGQGNSGRNLSLIHI